MDQHIKADIKRVFALQKKIKKQRVLQQPGGAEKSFSAF